MIFKLIKSLLDKNFLQELLFKQHYWRQTKHDTKNVYYFCDHCGKEEVRSVYYVETKKIKTTQRNKMKKTLTTLVMAILLTVSVNAQVFDPNCPTIEQQQQAYNQQRANGIVVRDTASHQLQTYYQQLATYWQQRHTIIQQTAKDLQQRQKDQQQIQKEAQLIAWENDLKSREAVLAGCGTELYNLKLLIEQLKLIINEDDCTCEVSQRIRDHINRSGGGDGTNPGGGGNDDGFDNPNNS